MIRNTVFMFYFILTFAFLCYGDKKMDKNDLKKLSYGTSYDEVINKFGEPDREIGCGFVIVGYEDKNSLIVLHFYTGGTLCGIWEEMNDGTEKIILPIKFPNEQ